MILFRAIVGIESYLPAAVMFKLGNMGLLNQSNMNYVRNPYSLNAKKMVEKYYHLLPELIDRNCSLKRSNPGLYEKNKIFYKEVRNPIFHGYQLDSPNLEGSFKVYKHVADLYKWIDSWYENDMVPPIPDIKSMLSAILSKKIP